MEYLLIGSVSLIASGLTFFSGFGLGTILLPVFALFFPIELAIAMTAIVHLLNNLLKLALTYRNCVKSVVIQFGVPALLSAMLGAFVLQKLSQRPSLCEYTLGEHSFDISPIKLVIAIVLLFFSLMELLPRLKKIQFPPQYLWLGGLLSGFFGGLSGNQGALRSAFLLKAGLNKDAFIASGVAIACLIDIPRLAVYSGQFPGLARASGLGLLFCAIVFACLGTVLGNRLVKKITIHSLQILVSIFLILFSILLGFGIV